MGGASVGSLRSPREGWGIAPVINFVQQVLQGEGKSHTLRRGQAELCGTIFSNPALEGGVWPSLMWCIMMWELL